MLTLYSISMNVGLAQAAAYRVFQKGVLRVSEPVRLSSRLGGPVSVQRQHQTNAGCLGNRFCWAMLVCNQTETHSLQRLRKHGNIVR